MNRVIAVDFDGVIHKYSKGWQDGSIYDPPIDGVKEALQKFRDIGYKIVIYSTRCNRRQIDGKLQESEIAQVSAYLNEHHIPCDGIASKEKPLASVYIDDNGYRFDGDWNTCVKDVLAILEQKHEIIDTND